MNGKTNRKQSIMITDKKFCCCSGKLNDFAKLLIDVTKDDQNIDPTANPTFVMFVLMVD